MKIIETKKCFQGLWQFRYYRKTVWTFFLQRFENSKLADLPATILDLQHCSSNVTDIEKELLKSILLSSII